MTVRVHIAGEKFRDLAGDLIAETLEPAKRTVEEGADRVVKRIRQKLSKVAATKRENAPAGQPPLDDPPAGEGLVASVSRGPARVAGKVVSASVTVDDEGANGLEFGFVDKKGRHHLPHPFVRPAFDELEREIDDLFHALED